MILREFDMVIKDTDIGDESKIKSLLRKYVVHFKSDSIKSPD
jgi:hypothetical protein